MKKLFLLFSTFAFVFCLGLSTASAMGFGLSATVGSGSTDWTSSDFGAFSTDTDLSGFGFTIDTNLARERMFNYRLELAKTDLTLKNFAGAGGDFELDGMMMTHDFGFGMRFNPLMKLWFGPELRFMWLEGTNGVAGWGDLDLFGFGLGMGVGLNVNFPGQLTLSGKLGYLMMDYAAEGNHPPGSSWETYDGEEDLVYLTVSFYFRSAGDQ